jgi:uncharacterized protein DUF1501
MHLPLDPLSASRRTFLGRTASLGSLALASLMSPDLLRGGEALLGKLGQSRGIVDPLHVPPKVRRVIFLYMSGGPSQFETFDNKPALAKLDREPMPESVTQGQPIAQLQGQKLYCMGPQLKFRRWGESGQEITELFPHIGSLADQICIIRSMHTDQINHDPAHTVMNTGTSISGRPSLGAWVLYGLGSESQDLPGFVVLTSEGGRSPQPIHNRMWHSGFLPSRLQGVRMHSKGDPVHYLTSPAGVSREQQADVVDSVSRLNRIGNETLQDPEVQTRISQYELAFRMQMSVPQLMDFSDEPDHVLDQYGTRGADGSFAANCILARRMAERGVRFIQLYHRDWDHHNDLVHFMNINSSLVDKATAALVLDLKQRGMLDETLIIWGGEFGRTPMAQGNKGKDLGRDHHMRAFSMWLAGGGIKGGITYGSTDELGYHVATDPVHVNDLHATLLHLLGMDHKRLTYRFQGRDFRLTDVGGNVLTSILA